MNPPILILQIGYSPNIGQNQCRALCDKQPPEYLATNFKPNVINLLIYFFLFLLLSSSNF